MALSINTNVGALLGAQSATKVNKDLQVNMQRLSTGKRINSASDDAAGVAIASRLTSEIKGNQQAIRNAMDGQSLLNTAEGAHNEVTNILQRMRELAVQASNDTNSTADRANLTAEMTALTAEIDRIAVSTSWAGIDLLNGTGTSLSPATAHSSQATFNLHVGSGTSTQDAMSVSIGAITSTALLGTSSTPTVTSSITAAATGVSGTIATSTTTTTDDTITFAGSFGSGDTYTASINGVSATITASTTDEYEDSASGVAAQMKAAFEALIDTADTAVAAGTISADQLKLAGVSVSQALGVLTFTNAAAVTITDAALTQAAGSNTIATGTNTITITSAGASAAGDSYDVTVNGEDVTYTATAGDGFDNITLSGHAAGLAAAISNNTDLKAAGYSASAVGGLITIARDGITASNVSTTYNAGTATLGESSGTFTVGGAVANGDVFNMTIDGTSVATTISTSDGYADTTIGVASQIAQNIKNAGITGLTVTDNANGTFALAKSAAVVITSAALAGTAITTIDTALATVNTQRSNLGALSNRIDSTVSNLSNVLINLESGRGRIEDADFAAESAALSKNQILAQASTAMLAQANASKQGILTLLQR